MAMDGMLADSHRRAIMEEKEKDYAKKKPSQEYNINILCLFGVGIGIIILMYLPYLVVHGGSQYIENIGFKEYSLEIGYFDIVWYNHLFGLVAIGLFVSIITPIGGILELIGLAIFLFDDIVLFRITSIDTYFILDSENGVGVILSLFSALIIVFSMMLPINREKYSKKDYFMRRLLTFSPKTRTVSD